jgi:hypothetical protein
MAVCTRVTSSVPSCRTFEFGSSGSRRVRTAAVRAGSAESVSGAAGRVRRVVHPQRQQTCAGCDGQAQSTPAPWSRFRDGARALVVLRRLLQVTTWSLSPPSVVIPITPCDLRVASDSGYNGNGRAHRGLRSKPRRGRTARRTCRDDIRDHTRKTSGALACARPRRSQDFCQSNGKPVRRRVRADRSRYSSVSFVDVQHHRPCSRAPAAVCQRASPLFPPASRLTWRVRVGVFVAVRRMVLCITQLAHRGLAAPRPPSSRCTRVPAVARSVRTDHRFLIRSPNCTVACAP